MNGETFRDLLVRATTMDGSARDMTEDQRETIDAIMAEVAHDEHLVELINAWELYRSRADERGEVWEGSGLLGQTFGVMAKAERAFRQVFEGKQTPSRDHFIDVINYATFALRLLVRMENKNVARGISQDVWDDHFMKGRWPW